MFGAILLHEFHIFYNHPEWTNCFEKRIDQDWSEVLSELLTVIIITEMVLEEY